MQLLLDRSVNIIMLTKRFGKPDEVKKAIAQYMSEECDCPIEVYTDSVLYSIVKEAVFDFIRCANERGSMIAFFREYLDANYEKDVDRLIIALSMARVAIIDITGQTETINGWHETEFTKSLDTDGWRLDLNKWGFDKRKPSEGKDLSEWLYGALIKEGQHNSKFRLGDIISNTPDEVKGIFQKMFQGLYEGNDGKWYKKDW